MHNPQAVVAQDGNAVPEGTRVLIVEDHPLVAHATAELLNKHYPQVKVAVCPDAHAAVREASTISEWYRVFVDLQVPGAVGLSLVTEFAKRGAADRTCIVTARAEPWLVEQAKLLGILGYVPKAIPVAEFSRAVDLVMAGQRYFPRLTTASPIRLTNRQQEILHSLQRGLTTKEIAAKFYLSQGTVNNHINALLSAMQASNRAHAVALGVQLGYLSMPDASPPPAAAVPGSAESSQSA